MREPWSQGPSGPAPQPSTLVNSLQLAQTPVVKTSTQGPSPLGGPSHRWVGGEPAQTIAPSLLSSSKKQLEFPTLDSILLAAAPLTVPAQGNQPGGLCVLAC